MKTVGIRRSLFLRSLFVSLPLLAFGAERALAQVPRLHLPFEEGAGLTTVDVSGNGNDGVLEAGVSWTQGNVGRALAFNGSSGVAVPSSATLAAPGTLTLAAWVSHPSPTQFKAVLDKRDSGDDGFDLYVSDQGRAFVRINTATLVSARVVADGTWHHLAAVYDGTNLDLYVDGSLDATANVGALLIDTTADLLIGKHFGAAPDNFFEGRIDEVRIYDRALDGVEVAELLEGGGPAGGSGNDGDWIVEGDDLYSAPAGRVGIGTTNPQEKLEVVGNITATGSICDSTGCIGEGSDEIWNQDGSHISYGGGNVGIGMANPSQRLEVDGNIKATGVVGLGHGDVCDSNTEGALRYVPTTKTFEGCDGTEWRPLSYGTTGGGGGGSEPDALTFHELTNQPKSTLVTSNTVVVSGLVGEEIVTVGGPGTPEIRINGAGWIVSGAISSGDTLQIRLLTAAMDSTLFRATVTINDFTAGWRVTTAGPRLGSGTSVDPYQLTNCEQLQGMRSDLEAHYILANDINCDLAPFNQGLGFEPIGGSVSDQTFAGVFDGNDREIEGLFVDRPNRDYVGLFGRVTDNARIENVHLVDVDIRGQSKVGGLVGGIESSRGSVLVAAASVQGNVTGTSNLGGVVGFAHAVLGDVTLTGLSSQGSVTGDSGGVGGLMGYALQGLGAMTISDSRALSNVTTDTGSVGGFLGGNSSGSEELELFRVHAAGVVTQLAPEGSGVAGGLVGLVQGDRFSLRRCGSAGQVFGDRNVGGLIGFLGSRQSLVSDCYSTSEVTGRQELGGLVGFARVSGGSLSITNTYAAGDVTSTFDGAGASDAGGLIGYGDAHNGSGWEVRSSFAVGRVTGTGTGLGGVLGNFGHLIGTASISNTHWYDNPGDDAVECASGNAGLILSCVSQTPISHFYDSGNAPLSSWDFDSVWQTVPGELPVLR